MSFMPKGSPERKALAMKNKAILGITPNQYQAISEQRVSMDSRQPLTKQWHRRQGVAGRKITPVT